MVVVKWPERTKLLNVTEILENFIPWITLIQYHCFMVLWICIIRIPSFSLLNLSKEIFARESATNVEMNQLIVEWKKSYVLVCDVVAEINAFLGQPIFIFFIMSMIISINMVFNLFVDIDDDLEMIGVDLFTILIFLIWNGIIFFVSDQIPQQVSKIDIIIMKPSKL